MKKFYKIALIILLLLGAPIVTNADNAQPKALKLMLATIPSSVKIVGVWEITPNKVYSVICKIGQNLYMQDLFISNLHSSDPQLLLMLSKNSCRYAEDTGESFVITKKYLLGYSYGEYAARWKQIL